MDMETQEEIESTMGGVLVAEVEVGIVLVVLVVTGRILAADDGMGEGGKV